MADEEIKYIEYITVSPGEHRFVLWRSKITGKYYIENPIIGSLWPLEYDKLTDSVRSKKNFNVTLCLDLHRKFFAK